MESRTNLEQDLRRAVPEQPLYLYYQMQIDSNYQVTGAEALVRGMSPVQGLM
ncbi:MAG: hypothetical protein R8K48_01070 [Gallionella sp.]